jgi:hypothetical protein
MRRDKNEPEDKKNYTNCDKVHRFDSGGNIYDISAFMDDWSDI